MAITQKYKKIIPISLFFLLFIITSNRILGNEVQHKAIINNIMTQYIIDNYSLCVQMINSAKEVNDYEKSVLIYIRAHCNYKLKEYDKAIEDFQSVVDFLPYKYETYNNIGACYFYEKDFTNALNYFNQAKKEYPHYKLAIKNYNITMQLLISHADKIYSQIPDISPYTSVATTYMAIGWCNYYLENNLAAIYYFKKAIENDPDYVLGYTSLGMVYNKIFNYQTALKYFKKAIEIDNEYPDLWNNIGITYYYLNNTAESIKCFNKAIELNNKYANPYNNRAFIFLDQKEIESAIKYFKKSIELNEADDILKAESFGGLSLCYYFKKDFKEAKINKGKAIKENEKIKYDNYLKDFYSWKEEYREIFLKKITSD